VRLRKSEWSVEELEQLAAIVAAGGTAFRAAAKFKRSIISCRNQACKMGMPFSRHPEDIAAIPGPCPTSSPPSAVNFA